MLEAKNIKVGYEGRLQTQKTDQVFRSGMIYSVIGKNGCGKSGLLKYMAGLQRSRSGTVLLDGKDVCMMPSAELFSRIGYLPAERKASGLPVEYVVGGALPLNAYTWTRISEAQRAGIYKTLSEWRLSGLAEIPLSKLSRGECQRVYLAALAKQNPDVLVLDEPTLGLDPESKNLFLNQLVKWKQAGKTVIYATQDLELALHYADEVIVVDAGKEVTAAPAEKMRTSGILEAVFHVSV